MVAAPRSAAAAPAAARARGASACRRRGRSAGGSEEGGKPWDDSVGLKNQQTCCLSFSKGGIAKLYTSFWWKVFLWRKEKSWNTLRILETCPALPNWRMQPHWVHYQAETLWDDLWMLRNAAKPPSSPATKGVDVSDFLLNPEFSWSSAPRKRLKS